MFFFRAVIHLLIRSKIYQYIAYQRTAGNQLKKFLPVQRYFSHESRSTISYIELLFPITVKVNRAFAVFLLSIFVGKVP